MLLFPGKLQETYHDLPLICHQRKKYFRQAVAKLPLEGNVKIVGKCYDK